METKGVKIFTIVITLMVIVILIIVFNSEAGQLNASLEYSRGKSTSVPEIKEAFHTEPDESKSLDSSALWHGPNNQHWLPGTVKEWNTIIVFDAATGEKLTSFGQTGNGPGDLSRPGGIAVMDDLAIIVDGSFYAVHDDDSITAIGWREIAGSQELNNGCN